MEILVTLAILLGWCSSDPEPLTFGAGGGGAGGTGGEAGQSATSGTAGGTGGEGGTMCQPSRDACGQAACGAAPDGCHGQISCGECAGNERCADGKCCITSCIPGWCGVHDDGCGGTVRCESVCGDGTMVCGTAGTCECVPPGNIPYADAAENYCQQQNLGHAMLCGSINDPDNRPYTDFPGSCTFMYKKIGQDGPWSWCCK